MPRGGVWKFKDVLTYEFLYRNWIVLDRSAADIGREFGGSTRPVYDALKRHGITSEMKKPQDLSAFLAAGERTRFKNGQVAPMKGRKGRSPAWKGMTKETHPIAALIADKTRGPRPHTRGPNHHNWKNGATSEAMLVRNSREYAKWRTAVFIRDKHTCQKCMVKGSRKAPLEAHHVLQFATHPHLRLEVSNGLTLCIPCHRATPHDNGSGRRRNGNPRSSAVTVRINSR